MTDYTRQNDMERSSGLVGSTFDSGPGSQGLIPSLCVTLRALLRPINSMGANHELS